MTSANGLGDLGSVPGRIIPKTLKMVLDTSFLITQQYKVRIKGKVEQSRERSSAPPIPWCSSYWKGNLLVALDYGRQLYFYYYDKLGQFITTYYLAGYRLTSIKAWQHLVKLLTNDWLRSCNNCYFHSIC